MDLLIIFGGPRSVHDLIDNPWIIQEKQFIRRIIEEGKAVLGICLGAQLIASAMGGQVYPASAKEIGWFPVQGISRNGNSTFRFPDHLEVFHWHSETFRLPPGLVRVAESEACQNQAFQMGSSVLGLQFHLESTPESARALVSHCRAELVPGQYVQSESTILATKPEKYRKINSCMGEVLSFLTGRQA